MKTRLAQIQNITMFEFIAKSRAVTEVHSTAKTPVLRTSTEGLDILWFDLLAVFFWTNHIKPSNTRYWVSAFHDRNHTILSRYSMGVQ
jgi:hypothetical protein